MEDFLENGGVAGASGGAVGSEAGCRASVLMQGVPSAGCGALRRVAVEEERTAR